LGLCAAYRPHLSPPPTVAISLVYVE
jgi:hypothetical protein